MILAPYIAFVFYLILASVGPSSIVPDSWIELARLAFLVAAAMLAVAADRVTNGRLYPRQD